MRFQSTNNDPGHVELDSTGNCYKNMARNAQESLAQLEKDNATIREQLEQAASFAGISFEKLGSDLYAEDSRPGPIHGREDWTFKWLLKKLSASQDARSFPDAWRLFAILARKIPVRNVARVMNERKFMSFLRETIEELIISGDESLIEKEPSEKSKSSKKRKRGEDTASKLGEDLKSKEFSQAAIHAAVQTILSLSKSEEAFDAEYLKSTVRASTEEAAKVLGAWFTLVSGKRGSRNSSVALSDQQLNPFIDIWTLRMGGIEDPTLFAKYCLQPSLRILDSTDVPPAWHVRLEELLARNLIVPARSVYISQTTTEYFKAFLDTVILKHPEFGPIIFELTIRCLPPRGDSRRKHADAVWLQSVFEMIKDIIKTNDVQSQVLGRLLRLCSQYHVTLELPILRSIVSQHVFASPYSTNWDVVITVLKLDANVFLIKESEEEDLLEQLLSRITQGPLLPSWSEFVDRVIDDVVVPLMGAFAKARDLSGFIYHWHAQLITSEEKKQDLARLGNGSAWEDNALLDGLRDVMEASLTTEQVVQLVDWIEEEVQAHHDTILVIAEAVAGAITKEDVIDAIGTRIQQFTFSAEQDHSLLSDSHTMRLLRIASNTLHWCSTGDAHQMRQSLSTLLQKPLGDGVSRYGTIGHLEGFRCLLQLWNRNSAADRVAAGLNLDTWVQSNQRSILQYLGHIIMDLKDAHAWGEDRWDKRSVVRNKGWFTCQYLQCIMVDHPESLRLILNDSTTAEALKVIIWAASASTPSSDKRSPNDWLRLNFDVLPSLWLTMLQKDCILDDRKTTGTIIQLMLDCGTHSKNPIESSSAVNGFVIRCLHQIPLEAFSRNARESVMTSWPDKFQRDLDDNEATLSYRMDVMDPAILSLKAKMMRRPTLYQGIKFQDLVDLAESVESLSTEPKLLLPIFASFVQLTLSHFTATIDQPKSQNYFQNMLDILDQWTKDNVKAKEPPPSTMIRLFEVILVSLSNKITHLESLNVLTGQKLVAFQSSFKKLLVKNFTRLLQKPKKLKRDDDARSMSFTSTVAALRTVQLEKEDMELLLNTVEEQSIVSLEANNAGLGRMAKAYIFEQISSAFAGATAAENLGGALFSSLERQAIHFKASSFAGQLDEDGKLTLAAQLLENGLANKESLDKLLAFKDVIMSCEDSRDSTHDDTSNATISSLYTLLSSKLWKADGFRQFCIISELMELILRTKGRSIVQYNIDSTLGSISIVCSRSGPYLPTRRAGTIYLHLCRLLQAVLVSHRLKLQGHFHLVVQTMQTLLHSLFTPTTSAPHTITRFPPWLAAASSQHHLSATHAAAYTRLVTLICDPSLSTVSRPGANQLSSAPARATRLAAQHMPLLLSAYIRLQLDLSLRMAPALRARLVPGVHAILDITTRDSRRVLGESLDASGRAVLGTLVRDWQQFGKWKGL